MGAALEIMVFGRLARYDYDTARAIVEEFEDDLKMRCYEECSSPEGGCATCPTHLMRFDPPEEVVEAQKVLSLYSDAED